MSQLYPRTTEQDESNRVTRRSIVIDSPEEKIEEERGIQRELGYERVDMLSWATSLSAQGGAMQSSVCVEV